MKPEDQVNAAKTGAEILGGLGAVARPDHAGGAAEGHPPSTKAIRPQSVGVGLPSRHVPLCVSRRRAMILIGFLVITHCLQSMTYSIEKAVRSGGGGRFDEHVLSLRADCRRTRSLTPEQAEKNAQARARAQAQPQLPL
jgi:hypothetical protein